MIPCKFKCQILFNCSFIIWLKRETLSLFFLKKEYCFCVRMRWVRWPVRLKIWIYAFFSKQFSLHQESFGWGFWGMMSYSINSFTFIDQSNMENATNQKEIVSLIDCDTDKLRFDLRIWRRLHLAVTFFAISIWHFSFHLQLSMVCFRSNCYIFWRFFLVQSNPKLSWR